MNIHEYQAKEVLSHYGISVAPLKLALTAEEARDAFTAIGAQACVVKAQIHAGGRGKGGGIKLVKSADEAFSAAQGMLRKPLVTHQTGPEGKLVRKVLVEAASQIQRELYVGVVIDRKSERPVLMASTEGGVEIEVVAAKTPEKILKEEIHPLAGLQPFQAKKLAIRLGIPKNLQKQAAEVFTGLAKAFVEKDLSLCEINPLAITADRGIIAVDAKINADDRGLFRHPDLAKFRDVEEEDPLEREAAEYDLNYVSLSGSIGCMVNGAGLAMSTMDMIKLHGGEPANFLDVGGGASVEQVTKAFKILLSNKNVRAVMVNIFGGIMKCDVIAQGIVEAAKGMKFSLPLVVRLEGTNVELGREILAKSGLHIVTATDMSDAAQKAVKAAAAR
jgi:succinyl-CoA synthetase beta subunit